jgi:hypothetical protein
VSQHGDFLLIPKASLCGGDDLAKIDRAQVLDPPAALRHSEPPLNGSGTRLPLKEYEQGMAVKDQSHGHANLLVRSLNSFLAREGLEGREPDAALMGSGTGGIK